MTIYQVFTRLFGNDKADCVPSGTKQQNGCGTMQAFTAKALEQIRGLGCTHIWFTGVIEHASKTDYSAYGIAVDNPDVVKGEAGSPYAIRDYYDIDPDLAKDPAKRIREFELSLLYILKAAKCIEMLRPDRSDDAVIRVYKITEFLYLAYVSGSHLTHKYFM